LQVIVHSNVNLVFLFEFFYSVLTNELTFVNLLGLLKENKLVSLREI